MTELEAAYKYIADYLFEDGRIYRMGKIIANNQGLDNPTRDECILLFISSLKKPLLEDMLQPFEAPFDIDD